MSKKVIPALIALVLALVWLSLSFVSFPVFAIIVGILAAIGVYEVEKSLGVTNKVFMAITLIFTAVGPVLTHFNGQLTVPTTALLCVYIIAILTMLVIRHETMEFKATAASTLISICLQYGFSCIVYLRDIYKLDANVFEGKKSYGMFFLLFAFFCSWMTDSMAFFAGSFFGKHKMHPKISPNKTIEGAIGGVAGNALLSLVMLAVFRHFFDIKVGFIFTACVAVVLSVISIFGDLAASVVKRQNGIKDFGNLIPGTGGIMDRFDSCLFVMPLLYSIISILNQYDAIDLIFY